jgi:hypothetical protein
MLSPESLSTECNLGGGPPPPGPRRGAPGGLVVSFKEAERLIGWRMRFRKTLMGINLSNKSLLCTARFLSAEEEAHTGRMTESGEVSPS